MSSSPPAAPDPFLPPAAPRALAAGAHDPRSDEPPPRWPPWTAPVVLVMALIVATVADLIVLGVASGTSSVDIKHPPPGVELVSTLIQDVVFVVSAVLVAGAVSGRVSASQFGLRRTPFWRAFWLVAATLGSFLLFTVIWVSALGLTSKEDLPNQLGANQGGVKLIASALLVAVVAPIGEEVLFRGYIFTALRSWRGVWPAALITGGVFGAIHAGSAPVGYLVPLAFFGVGLCLLYARTRSLYPCIFAHSINNSLAFGVTLSWGWQIPVLMVAAIALLALLALALTRLTALRSTPLAPA